MSTTTPTITTPTGPPGAHLVDQDLAADIAAAALDVARKFHDGATLWVIAPQWEPHAHHVAVEFVHPVIVGKRALPSVALVEPDPVAQVRVASQRGDLLLAVASADQPAAVDAMRRAGAWGVTTLWIGCGPRPPAGAAHHTVMSTALNSEHLTDLAEMLGVELALIGAETKTSQFLKELRWNNAYHRLAMGF